MTYSNLLYQPSILELARAGNVQAIAYWMNTFLVPSGIYVNVGTSPSGGMRIWVHLQDSALATRYQGVKERLIRSICYRLWTLNSSAIDTVHITAKVAGKSHVLWRQSVRIVTPANADRVRAGRSATLRLMSRVQFQIFRSWFLSHASIATLVLIGWFSYFELATQPITDTAWGHIPPKVTLLRPIAPSIRHFSDPLVTEELAELRQGTFPVDETYLGQVVREAPAAGLEKTIALTFNGGPWFSTPQILDILKQYNIRATFFMIGRHLEMYPDVARRVVAEGHAVGNHTMNHLTNAVDATTAREEVDRTAQLMQDILGIKTSLFRPPAGQLDSPITEHAQQQQYVITLWSVEAQDYFVAAPLVVDNILRGVKPGSIVLLHDGGGDRASTIEALPQIIETLLKQGYRFITVPELLNPPQQPTAIGMA